MSNETDKLTALSNKSKEISSADDSAGRFLKELLGDDPGRNFDVDSIFAYKDKNGDWGWVIFEFLKNDASYSTVISSHPNRYWKKNKRKFISLWALTTTLRKSGFKASLYLVNYDEELTKIKVMTVDNLVMNTFEKWNDTNHFNHIITTDKVYDFKEFKEKFRNFNKTKKGETWEILNLP